MKIMCHILTALELNILQKKSRRLWATEILQQIFLEYNHIIQCADTFVLDLLTLSEKVKIYKPIPIYFLQANMK